MAASCRTDAVPAGHVPVWAVHQDGDSGANPHDIDDAAASAANYLCGGRGGTVVDERTALRYNRDESYAWKVLTYADELEEWRPGAWCTSWWGEGLRA